MRSLEAEGRVKMTTRRVVVSWVLVGAMTFLGTQVVAQAAVHKRGKIPKGTYGAIAYHRASGSFGYSFDFRSSREAKTEALRQCNHPQCEVVLGCRSTCAALASGPKKYGALSGTTRQEAEAKALRKCGEKGCEVLAWACTK